MCAGLAHSHGQAVILSDADLQDPPELIPQMITHWQSGYKVVNMQRRQRCGEGWFKRHSASAFYRLLNTLTQTTIPENVGDFRLLAREVVEHINQLPERNRYMKGIFVWPGYSQITMAFDRDPRFCGQTKWNTASLAWRWMALPSQCLRVATVTGAVTALTAFDYGLFIIIKALFRSEPVSGYPSTMVVLLMPGRIQLLSIGLLGSTSGAFLLRQSNVRSILSSRFMNKNHKKPSS